MRGGVVMGVVGVWGFVCNGWGVMGVGVQFKLMSRPLGQGRGAAPLRDFTYSVDIKKFSRERGNLTPAHLNQQNFFKKIQERSNEKIRQSQPSSLAATFSKHISQKNVAPKRRLSSGFPKTHHHSVSLDQHLLRQRYALAREMFTSQQFEQLILLARSLLPHFEHSSAQRTLRYWLASSLMQVQRLEEAVQEMNECLGEYPHFAEGELCLANAHLRLRNYQTAVQHFQAAGRLDPRSATPALHLAHSYQLMQDHEKCRDLCNQMVLRFPQEGEFLMLLVESSLQLGEVEQAEKAVQQAEGAAGAGKRDSLGLYVRGLVEKERGNEGEAYILFEEALKYNNSRVGVSRALMEVVKMEIERRDFYKAHHSMSRMRFLEVQQTEEMAVYALLIQGVMTMMKKKSQEAIDILLRVLSHRRCAGRVVALVHKYLGYGYFKVSEYAKSIKHYQKLPSSDNDPSSHYNKLLAEGVELADTHHRYEQAIDTFNQAKLVYPQKVEPYIYIAMVHVLRSNTNSSQDNTKEVPPRHNEHKNHHINPQDKDKKAGKGDRGKTEGKAEAGKAEGEEVRRAEAVIEALKELQVGNRLNPNSSNLLYHRTILHLYFQDWQSAHEDINRCIEKAQENLPKYFYLRGVCYCCLKDYKKAINEYSICLSLDGTYAAAYLEKAKCYFLLGNTQKGFSALKVFMELSPNDLSIYRWIGDLLYEGMSYRDALKAYAELAESPDLDTQVMKLKCQFRVGSLSEINSQLRGLESQGEREKLAVDATALGLLGALVRGESKAVGGLVKRVNKQLQANSVGYLFQLIDCMNLLGVASFYLEKYSDAYESFLLVLELYQSLSEKETVSLKSECCDEELDLRAEDIYFNLILCEIAQDNAPEAIRMINEEYLAVTDGKRRKQAERMARSLQEERGDKGEAVEWELKSDRPINNKLRKVELVVGKLKVKTKPVFNLYHHSAQHLYASSVADKLVRNLHAAYIDNMPEGPWIRRNPYGVIFTEQVMPSDNSISFEDSSRVSGSKAGSVQSLEEEKAVSRKEEVLRQLRFDEAVEAKLNSMIKKRQASHKDTGKPEQE